MIILRIGAACCRSGANITIIPPDITFSTALGLTAFDNQDTIEELNAVDKQHYYPSISRRSPGLFLLGFRA
jgi:hypothetical protein